VPVIVETIFLEGTLFIAHAFASARMTRRLTDNERNAIETVIGYKAEQLKISRRAVEQSLYRSRGVQSVGELMAWDYDGVIRFLLAFAG
jgi:hypothetical protein